jgi:hypothetical protein
VEEFDPATGGGIWAAAGDRAILCDVVFQILGKQGVLRTIFAFDKSFHRALGLTDDHSMRAEPCTEFSRISLDPTIASVCNRDGQNGMKLEII